jgi:outer membrane protein TolC
MMRNVFTLLVAAALAGCASYTPVPVAPAAVAARQAGVTLDAAAVAPVLARIAPGSQSPAGRWDRLSLFAALLHGNADIAAARAAIDSASAARRASAAPPGATLTLTTEYAANAPESSPWLFGGAIDIPIDAGGRRASRLAIADLGIVAARYDYAETVWTVRMALRRALADRLMGQARLAAATDIVTVRQRQFDAMARRVAAGAASRADLERVRGDTADAMRRQADARTQIATGNAGLAGALGVPAADIAAQVVIWDGFPGPAAQPVADAAARQGAIAARADVLKSATQYDQAEADLRGEIARQYPAISIGPGYTWERGLVKLPINLALVLPPLDGNRGAIAAAEARRQEAAARLEAMVAAAQASVDQALAATQLARAALAKVRQGEIPAAERLARQADNELRAGAIDRSEWAAAQAGARLARLSELDALAAVHAADADLEAALRRPVEGPELAIRNGLEAFK